MYFCVKRDSCAKRIFEELRTMETPVTVILCSQSTCERAAPSTVVYRLLHPDIAKSEETQNQGQAERKADFSFLGNYGGR